MKSRWSGAGATRTNSGCTDGLETCESGFWGGRRRGLCYEWQSRVLADLSGVAEDLGWRAAPIGRDVGGLAEHHAVLLYDPEQVLDGDESAFVLDPWRRGAPDVYALGNWRGE